MKPKPLYGTPVGWRQQEELLESFAQAWLRGETPSLADYVPAAGPERRSLLIELVRVDVEFRRKAGLPAPLEQYLTTFPELAAEAAVLAEWGRPKAAAADPYATKAETAVPGNTPSPLASAPENYLATLLSPAQGPDELGRLDGYRVLSILGKGGMGLVFEAEDIVLKRRVALKVILPQYLEQADARLRFLREARAAAALQSDHVIPIHQVGEDRGVPYLAMPLLHGETLESRLRAEGRLPLQEVLHIGRETALGLAAAHAKGLIHRDIKPSNLWLETRDEAEASGGSTVPGPSPRGARVKILDFGLTRDSGADMHITNSGTVLGTPGYMAPEQVEGKLVDLRCDLFSLGCVLYKMATGQLPFQGETPIQILRSLAVDQPRPPGDLNPNLPSALSALILRLLAKDPQGRPASAAEVAGLLARFEKEIDATAESVSRSAPVKPKHGRRWLRVAGLLGAAALLAGGIVTILIIWAKMGAEPGGDDKKDVPPPAKIDPYADIREDEREYLKVVTVGTGKGQEALNMRAAERVARWREAAQQNFPIAQNLYGECYDWGIGTGQNYTEAVEWYRRAAEQGYAPAQFNLARMYENGLGMPKDDVRAVAWYRKSAEQGYAPAQHGLGVMYQYGYGMHKDDVEAVAWFRKSAEQGYAPAQHSLGWMYENGLGLPKDVIQAVAWYRKSAEQGYAPVQFNLGVMYESGQGVPKDEVQAIAWYRKAADQGDEDAKKALERLGKQTPPQPGDAKDAKTLADRGVTLEKNGDLEGAIALYRKAIQLDPNYSFAHQYLGGALYAKKDLEGAFTHYQKALQLYPYDMTHKGLGNVLRDKKDLDGAIMHYRKAIALDPNWPYYHHYLGEVLLRKGQFVEARQATLQYLKLLPADYPYRESGQKQLKQCDDLLALDGKLVVFLKSGKAPKEIGEQLALADLCGQYKGYHAAAARLYAGAFAAEPTLGDDLTEAHRYHAACSAVLAAAGKGLDPKKPDAKEKSTLRGYALDWLRADLELFSKYARARPPTEDVFLLLDKLPQWQEDTDLTSIRDPKALSVLPADEQLAWLKLWAEASQLLKQVKASFTETALKGTLTDKERTQVHEQKLVAGKTYIIDMNSTVFDTYLKLLDDKGNLVAENDDIAPDNLNSRLMFTPEKDGTFRIVATSFQQRGVGAYTITIRAFNGKAGSLDQPD